MAKAKMRDEVEFWRSCLRFARQKRCPEPDDAAQEMFTNWMESGKPENVNLYFLFCNAARKQTKWDSTKKHSCEPVLNSIRDDGENHVFDKIAAPCQTSLDDDTIEVIRTKLRELEKTKKALKALQEAKALSPDDPADWPFPHCTLQELEREHIRQMIVRYRENRTHAAHALGISIRCLRYKLAELEHAPFGGGDFRLGPKKSIWAWVGPKLTPREGSVLEKGEDELVIEACQKANWKIKDAAEALGINRTTLHEKLKRLLKNSANISIEPEGQEEPEEPEETKSLPAEPAAEKVHKKRQAPAVQLWL